MSAVPGAAAVRPHGPNTDPAPKGVVCRTHFAEEDRHTYGFYRDPHGAPPGQIRVYRMDARKPQNRVLFEDLPASAQKMFLELCRAKCQSDLQWSPQKLEKLKRREARTH